MISKPIIVVHVITSLGMGGAERSLSNIAMRMDKTKFKHVVISLQDLGFWGPILQQAGITVVALNMRPGISSLLKFPLLIKITKQFKPDYIQGWMYHANLYALIIGKLLRVKNIYWNIRCSLMDLSKYSIATRVVFKFGRLFAGKPNMIICNSKQSMLEHMNAGFKNKNWQFIANGFDPDHFKPNIDIYKQFRAEHLLPNDAIIFGMVARFDPMKDHKTFFKAAGILTKFYPNAYFVCAGNGVSLNNSEIKEAVFSANIQAKTIFLGRFNEVNQLYPAFDFLTLPSLFGEGFPNVIAEAMLSGVYCFVTDVGDSKEIIGDQGCNIDKNDAQKLAESWLSVINDTSKLRCESIRQRIIDNFSLSNTIKIYEKCYLGEI